jgi:large subunit ribosomal protein L3
MARGIIAKKIGMSQIFDASGKLVPVTVLQAGPCPVLQVKTSEKEKYGALQLGFVEVRESLLTRAEVAHSKKNSGRVYRHIAEFRDFDGFGSGQEIKADIFQKGDIVKITGVSKGKGYQGVVKRHGFGGGRKTHGSKFHREPGSQGAGTFPAEVFKGKRAPGHLGDDTVSMINVEIVEVDAVNNLLFVKGGVPGARTSIVTVEAMAR